MTTPAASMAMPKHNLNQIPTEFRYAENIGKRRVQIQRQILKRLIGRDPVLPEPVIQQYASSYYDADPVAEAFVEEVYLKRGQAAGRQMVDQALEHGVSSVPNAPQSLKNLFAEIEVNPAWLDWEQVELGARVFRRWGTHLYSFAGAITLEGYQENSVAKPLAFTGAYTGESANRRFLETAGFWIDVSEPGGLRPGGQGVKTSLRVRLMHVFVRQRLIRHPKWDMAAWGVPISQGDAILTLMGGSFMPGMLLKILGYRTSKEEIEATLHFWRYVGHLVGVQPKWYPTTVAEAAGLMFTAYTKGVRGAGDDARNLAQSYVDSYKSLETDSLWTRLDKALEYRLQLGYVNLFLPRASYKQYGLPNPGLWLVHPFLQFAPRFAFETLRKNIPAVDAWHDSRVRKATKNWVNSRLGKRKVEYQAVESFTR